MAHSLLLKASLTDTGNDCDDAGLTPSPRDGWTNKNRNSPPRPSLVNECVAALDV